MPVLTSKQLTFTKPTSALRELLILSAIDEDPSVSQTLLAQRAGVVSSMANNYIKDLVKRGLVRTGGETNRDKTYRLTPEGQRHKHRLATARLIESIIPYQEIRRRFTARLRELAEEGIKRVVLFGAAETGEIALLAASSASVDIVGVVDSDVTKHGMEFGGITVCPPSTILSLRPDAVLIASFARRDEMYKSIGHISSHGIAIRDLWLHRAERNLA